MAKKSLRNITNKKNKNIRPKKKTEKTNSFVVIESKIEIEIEETEETEPHLNEDEKQDASSETKEKLSVEGISDILFKLPIVTNPLVGTPKQVQEELDSIALKIQKHPQSKKNDSLFSRIHLYMHGYLLNVVLKQFPYIRGLQTNDIYQEALLAIRFKAIPGFDKTKGMSFLNFAKMCIRRQLITVLNASLHRQKDKSINEAISLDSTIPNDDSGNTFSNTISDDKPSADEKTETNEAIRVTKETLMNELSDFEKLVLSEYLTSSSYKEIAQNICRPKSKKRLSQQQAKAVDNALLRIRKKAMLLRNKSCDDDLPLFIK